MLDRVTALGVPVTEAVGQFYLRKGDPRPSPDLCNRGTAEGFFAELGALPVKAPIDLRLNSPCGPVFDTLAIFQRAEATRGPVTVG
jgi:hypothetical protein